MWWAIDRFPMQPSCVVRNNSIQGRIQRGPLGLAGAIAPLKPTKVSLFTKIFYNSENNIRDIA